MSVLYNSIVQLGLTISLHLAEFGRFAGFCYRRLSTLQGQSAGIVLGQHRTFINSQQGAVFLDPDQKFGAAHTGDGVRGFDFQAAGLATEKVGCALEHVKA